ncbi:MAG: hypothetical protein M3Y41_02590, partial [Pseudomonadota bacterium]|nr:hypothetical protein [Pseudomonadota bacterium]
MPDHIALLGRRVPDHARAVETLGTAGVGRDPATECRLQLEDGYGRPLDASRAVATHWHRPPYAMMLRLVRHAQGASEPEIVDQAVVGTRGSREEFRRRLALTAERLRKDAEAGLSRGASGSASPALPRRSLAGSLAGRLDHAAATWRQRLFSEWWSVGITAVSL